MDIPIPRLRTLSFLVGVLLAVMLELASLSAPPTLSVSDLSSVEDGSVVFVVGVLVSSWMTDSGAARLTLAALRDSSTLSVICIGGSGGTRLPEMSIGDELKVKGEVSGTGPDRVMFASSGSVYVLRRAEMVLTLPLLGANWELFEGDRFNITGMLTGDLTTGLFLTDPQGTVAVSLSFGCAVPPELIGYEVVLDCRLYMDSSDLRLRLHVMSMTSAP